MGLRQPSPYGREEDLALSNVSLLGALRRERARLSAISALHRPVGTACSCGQPDHAACPTVRALNQKMESRP